MASDPKFAAVKEIIDRLLEEHAVVIISKSYCPYCTKAKVS